MFPPTAGSKVARLREIKMEIESEAVVDKRLRQANISSIYSSFTYTTARPTQPLPPSFGMAKVCFNYILEICIHYYDL